MEGAHHCGWLDVTFEGQRKTLFVVLMKKGVVSCYGAGDNDARMLRQLPDISITASSRIQMSENCFQLLTPMATFTFSIPEAKQKTCDVKQELQTWTRKLAINIFSRRDSMKTKRHNSFTSAGFLTEADRAVQQVVGNTSYMDDDVGDLTKFIKEKNEWVAHQEKQFLASSSAASLRRLSSQRRRGDIGSLKLLLTEAGLRGATYTGDYLNFGQKLLKLKSHFVAAGGSSMEKLLFSSVVNRVYASKYHFVRSPRQRRVLVLTTRALYEMNSGKKIVNFRRRIKISDIAAATVTEDLPDVVALRLPTHYDLLHTCQRRTEFLCWLMLAKGNKLYTLTEGSRLQLNFESPIRLKVKGGAIVRTQFDESTGRIRIKK